jgi:hypothetical protein
MTETERTALLHARCFAQVFIDAVNAELYTDAPSGHRKDAAKQLQAALRIIEEE